MTAWTSGPEPAGGSRLGGGTVWSQIVAGRSRAGPDGAWADGECRQRRLSAHLTGGRKGHEQKNKNTHNWGLRTTGRGPDGRPRL